LYWELGEYQRAIVYLDQCLDISQDPGMESERAAALNNLGLAHFSLGDVRRAIDLFREALGMHVELGDTRSVARSAGNLGMCYDYIGDFELGMLWYEEALEKSRVSGDRQNEANVLSNMGLLYEALLEFEDALTYHHSALNIRVEINDQAKTAISLYNIAHVNEYLGELGSALAYYEQSLSSSQELGMHDTERLAQWGLGSTYRSIGELETALLHYEAAIGIVESIRNTVGGEGLRQSYLNSQCALYEEYLEILLDLGQNEKTLSVAERLRTRTFLDALYQSSLGPEELRLGEAGINRTTDEQLPVMDSEALQAAVVEAQDSFLPNEAVLEYMVGDDSIYLWVLTDDNTLGPDIIPYEREQLMRDVVALRQAVEEPQTRDVGGEPDLFFKDPMETLSQFYEVLLQPALAQLDETIDTLLFVPSGPLWYIPFAALVMTDQPQIQVEGVGLVPTYRPTYLVDRYTLAFLPSLASGPMLMEEDTASTGSYLALANPILSEEQQTAVGSNYQHEGLEAACRSFATYVGGDEANVHVQAEAQEALAVSSSTGQRVLMYACHGDFNPSVPLDSRLLLSTSEEEADGSSASYLLDGDYHASEILLTDHTGVELVILAACETLLPALREAEGVLGLTLGPESDDELSLEQLELIVAGDEVVGLSRAFLSSGAKSVLGTLWQASPAAIEELLISLGGGSQDGMSWAEALREAQRELIANENYDDVWFWAPYQLIGMWR